MSKRLTLTFLFVFCLSCEKDDTDVIISKSGFPFRVSVIATQGSTFDGSREYLNYDLIRGADEASEVSNLSSQLGLESETRISSTYKDVLLFVDYEQLSAKATFININNGGSHQLTDVLNDIGAPELAFGLNFTVNSSSLFTFYRFDDSDYNVQIQFSKYDFATGHIDNFLLFDGETKSIGEGLTNTGITASDEYLFIKYENRETPGEIIHVLDVYDAGSLKKVETFESEFDFGFVQDGANVMFSFYDGSEFYNELININSGNKNLFSNEESIPLRIGSPGHTKIRDSKVALGFGGGYGMEPWIMDFNDNEHKLINDGFIRSKLDYIPNDIAVRFHAFDIDLSNEIAALAYSKRISDTETVYEIVYIDFGGEVLYRTKLPPYEPQKIIIY